MVVIIFRHIFNVLSVYRENVLAQWFAVLTQSNVLNGAKLKWKSIVLSPVSSTNSAASQSPFKKKPYIYLNRETEIRNWTKKDLNVGTE